MVLGANSRMNEKVKVEFGEKQEDLDSSKSLRPCEKII